MYGVFFRITSISVHRFQGASVPAAPTMAAAEAEAAEAAAAPPVAEVELTAEQEDLLASFLSDVTQVFYTCCNILLFDCDHLRFRSNKGLLLRESSCKILILFEFWMWSLRPLKMIFRYWVAFNLNSSLGFHFGYALY